jgi:hypothetical protein
VHRSDPARKMLGPGEPYRVALSDDAKRVAHDGFMRKTRCAAEIVGWIPVWKKSGMSAARVGDIR